MGYDSNRALLETAKTDGHQKAVDLLQAQIRADLAAGRRELFRPAVTVAPVRSEDLIEQRIAEELETIVRQLEQMGGALAADPILLSRHAMQLQSIDLMKQVIGHLAQLVASADREAALERVTLTELKRRLTRQSIRPIGNLAV